jgi:hypothetical protein
MVVTTRARDQPDTEAHRHQGGDRADRGRPPPATAPARAHVAPVASPDTVRRTARTAVS